MRSLLVIGIMLLLWSCESVEPEPAEMSFPDLMELPEGFPAVPESEGNAFSKARWELGKKLFFDPIMSVDSSISCASCHAPDLAFSDDKAVSLGVEGRAGRRNSPSLANIAYHPYFTREGGVPTLEMQVLVPIQEHDEFDFNILLIAERMLLDDDYVTMSETAYERAPDPYVITRALACFERSLLSGWSSYDDYVNGRPEHSMSASALRGMELFFSDRTQCSSCHSGFNFTDYSFTNNGLYEDYPDPGRFRLTNEETDRATFKVPSLRNIALTAPYMHDGSLPTLEAVIAHYNSGGFAHPNKAERIQPLGLTSTEQDDIVAFLESLTDRLFIENPLFRKEE